MKQSTKERIIGKAIHHFRIRYGWTMKEIPVKSNNFSRETIGKLEFIKDVDEHELLNKHIGFGFKILECHQEGKGWKTHLVIDKAELQEVSLVDDDKFTDIEGNEYKKVKHKSKINRD
jgi:hypothetical protein